MAKEDGTVRFSVELSSDMAEELNQLAAAIRGSKADVFRRGMALVKLAVEAKNEGQKFGVADASGHLTREIVGI